MRSPVLFRVITDPREWRHFKMLNEVYTSVEEGMFNTKSESGFPEIYLRPKESVNVPFKFLSVKGDHSVQPEVLKYYQFMLILKPSYLI